MHIPIHVKTKKIATRVSELRMDCPSCDARCTGARAADITAKESLYGLIPTSTSQWTEIVCLSCRRVFRVSLCCGELETLTPAQLSELVATDGMSHVGNIPIICIVFSIVFGIVPFFGLGCAVAGIIGTRNSRSRWRTAAFVGLAISTVSTAGVFLLLALGK
jgi:hypothetical protein